MFLWQGSSLEKCADTQVLSTSTTQVLCFNLSLWRNLLCRLHLHHTSTIGNGISQPIHQRSDHSEAWLYSGCRQTGQVRLESQRNKTVNQSCLLYLIPIVIQLQGRRHGLGIGWSRFELGPSFMYCFLGHLSFTKLFSWSTSACWRTPWTTCDCLAMLS